VITTSILAQLLMMALK